MDADLVNAFIESSLFTLEKTASVKFNPLKPFLEPKRTAKGEISGVIELTGDIRGTLSISFERKTIFDIVSRMFGESLSELNDDIKDAVGELLNMVAGRINTKLSGKGQTVTAKLLKVLTGSQHVLPHDTEHPVISIPVGTDSGVITLQVCVSS
jgi:chemotaxis protein CheX